jgi:hypothetical protein
MAPSKEATTFASTPKKHHSKLSVGPIHEEITRVSSLELRFRRYYIPPRKDTNPINLSKDAKYELVEPEIPPGVIVEEDMLGLILSLKYADHDITDKKKFMKLASSKYLKSYINIEIKMVVIELEI